GGVEGRERGGSGELLVADELQGDDATHMTVAGLEDGAHAALAEAVDENVGADEEFLRSPGNDLVDLVSGQPAALKDLPRQGARVGLLRFRQLGELLQLLRLEKPTGP